MPLQKGAYLALSRQFCRQVNISKIFSLVRQTRNTRAEPVAMVKPAGCLAYGLRSPDDNKPLVGAVKPQAPMGCKVVGTTLQAQATSRRKQPGPNRTVPRAHREFPSPARWEASGPVLERLPSLSPHPAHAGTDIYAHALSSSALGSAGRNRRPTCLVE